MKTLWGWLPSHLLSCLMSKADHSTSTVYHAQKLSAKSNKLLHDGYHSYHSVIDNLILWKSITTLFKFCFIHHAPGSCLTTAGTVHVSLIGAGGTLRQRRQFWQHAMAPHNSHNTHTHSHKSLYMVQRSRRGDLFLLNLWRKIRVLISMQNVPKTSNGRLWGGRDGSHIKEINQHHNFGSTWASFHLNHIAKHLASNTLILGCLRLL